MLFQLLILSQAQAPGSVCWFYMAHIIFVYLLRLYFVIIISHSFIIHAHLADFYTKPFVPRYIILKASVPKETSAYYQNTEIVCGYCQACHMLLDLFKTNQKLRVGMRFYGGKCMMYIMCYSLFQDALKALFNPDTMHKTCMGCLHIDYMWFYLKKLFQINYLISLEDILRWLFGVFLNK